MKIKQKVSGVYKLYDINKKLIYIGVSSSDLYNRTRKSILDKNADYVSVCETSSDLDASIIEVALIGKYKPIMNKCAASKSIIESTIQIKEPSFSAIVNVNVFMEMHNLPSILHAKIHKALSYKIVQENEYNTNPSALIYSNVLNETVVLIKNRINNIFIDMLNKNSKENLISGIVIPCKNESNHTINFTSYAKLYTSSILMETMDYERFIPFCESYAFDLIIIEHEDDFNLVKEIFQKEGLRIWN